MSHQMNRAKALSLALAVGLIFTGCAKERPVKPLIPNTSRVAKAAFNGTYLYLQQVTDVQSPGAQNSWLAPGMYLQSDQLVQFKFKEAALEVVSIDPQYQREREAKTNAVLANFSAKHVDVLRRQNVDGEDTHEEEETTSRREWPQRDYAIIDITADAADPFTAETVVATAVTGVELDEAAGAINFSVERRLKDDTVVTVRHSFLKYTPSATYEAKEYPRELQKKFGFFKNTILSLDKYDRITSDTRKDVANRWDASQKVVYYLSKNFPPHLAAQAKQVFANWNEAFKAATGNDVLELRDNSGQELGDLRYSLVTYDANETALHRILGYGPSFSNPRTGQIIKADVILYGGSLKRSLYSERIWENLLKKNEATGLEALFQRLLPSLMGGEEPQGEERGNGESRLANLMAPFHKNHAERLSEPAGLQMAEISAKLDPQEKAVLDQFAPRKAVAEIREAYLKDHMKQITRVNEDVMRLLNEAKHAETKELSDEELEVQIFTPLLAHELGHTLGLRHNFAASADHRHFGAAKTSSVMDYGFLSSHEPQEIGQYDRAAIEMLYGNNAAKAEAALADNFYFCTDENIYDSRNALCNQFDAGTTLTETISNQMDRYFAAYVFNNLRGDRIYMGSLGDYIGRVSRYLIPVRMAFDNAQAILNAARGSSAASLWYVTGQRIEADSTSKPESIVEIEVPESFNVQVVPGQWQAAPKMVKRRLDRDKLMGVIRDAQQAKNAAFNALLEIVLDEQRSLYSSGDLVHDELQVRGTLYDKILAMMYLYTRTPDPSGNGGVISMYRDLDNGGAAVFMSHLLANTSPVMDPATQQVSTRITPYDINLREMALSLLWTELAVAGSSASSRELLASEKVKLDIETLNQMAELRPIVLMAPELRKALTDQQTQVTGRMVAAQMAALGFNLAGSLQPLTVIPALLQINDALALEKIQEGLKELDAVEKEFAELEKSLGREEKLFQSIETLRAQMRVRYKRLVMGGLDDATRGRLAAEIQGLEAERAKINATYTLSVGNTYLKAPFYPPHAPNPSTVGRNIRDNINRLEDQRAAVLELVDEAVATATEELKKPKEQQNATLLSQLSQFIQQMEGRIDALGEYLASEKLLVETMYQLYNQR